MKTAEKQMAQSMKKRQVGFTLIELMITVAIMAILIAIAVPSFERSIRSARVDSATNSLLSGIATARNEAMRRGRVVAICASADPSALLACGLGVAQQGGWIVYFDTNTNGVLDAGEEIKVGAPSNVAVTGDGNIGTTVFFDRRGTMVTNLGAPAPTGTLIVNANPCTLNADKQITITVNTAGLTRLNTVAETCP